MTSGSRAWPLPKHHRMRPRGGFSLMELMLVLALIVVVGAMAAPAFHGPIEDFRLLKSADLVRARWSKARSEAMRTGRTMMFRYQAQTGLFEIAPWQGEEDYLESSQLFSVAAPVQTSASNQPRTEELGENITFAGLSAVASSRDMLIQQTVQNQGATGQWSPPILFYPDGTSTTTRVTLANKRQRYVMIQLRGLSGVAEVSDLLTAAELPS